MQPSRRAFLLGRRPVQTPWTAFVQRLALMCQGQVRDLGEGAACAILTPARDADVTYARALCAQYGVVLELADATGPFAPVAGPRLRVDPALLAGLTRLDGGTPRWRAQPGVPLAELVRAGLRQFTDLPGAMTLAQWLSAPAPWLAGRCAESGVVAVDVILADGVEETMGPFGEADVQPLRSATMQRLVPALFQLAAGSDASVARDDGRWPGRYRLDALKPIAPASVNLAHLLLGHGGTLAWVSAVTLADAPAWTPSVADQDPQGEAVLRRDGRIKTLFDSDGRFPSFMPPAI